MPVVSFISLGHFLTLRESYYRLFFRENSKPNHSPVLSVLRIHRQQQRQFESLTPRRILIENLNSFSFLFNIRMLGLITQTLLLSTRFDTAPTHSGISFRINFTPLANLVECPDIVEKKSQLRAFGGQWSRAPAASALATGNGWTFVRIQTTAAVFIIHMIKLLN